MFPTVCDSIASAKYFNMSAKDSVGRNGCEVNFAASQETVRFHLLGELNIQETSCRLLELTHNLVFNNKILKQRQNTGQSSKDGCKSKFKKANACTFTNFPTLNSKSLSELGNAR